MRNEFEEGRDSLGQKPAGDMPSSGGGGGLSGLADNGHGNNAPAIAALTGLQRRRRFLIRLQQKITNATGAFLRSEFGWSPALPERERKAINARAYKALRALAKAAPVDGVDPDAAVMVRLSLGQRAPFDDERQRIEAEMKRLARSLPVYPFAAGVKGFGDLGLAIIVAEAGDLSNYPSHGHLWKRLGVAPKAAYHDAKTEAYLVPRQRRSQCYIACSDTVLRHQWRGEKTDAESGEVISAHATGPYGEHYARKKAEYLAREGWTPKHADMAARRYMEKRLLKDLWRAWRVATKTLPSEACRMMPPANTQET